MKPKQKAVLPGSQAEPEASSESLPADAPGGPDATPSLPADESTTVVPAATGITQAEALEELAANPARTSVLSQDGHVLRP